MKDIMAEHEIEYYATDGRLCEPSNDKLYRMRDAIALCEKLGRPLTNEEMEQFLVREDVDNQSPDTLAI